MLEERRSLWNGQVLKYQQDAFSLLARQLLYSFTKTAGCLLFRTPAVYGWRVIEELIPQRKTGQLLNQ